MPLVCFLHTTRNQNTIQTFLQNEDGKMRVCLNFVFGLGGLDLGRLFKIDFADFVCRFRKFWNNVGRMMPIFLGGFEN